MGCSRHGLVRPSLRQARGSPAKRSVCGTPQIVMLSYGFVANFWVLSKISSMDERNSGSRIGSSDGEWNCCAGQSSSVSGSVTLRARVGWPGERPASYYPTRVENGAVRCIEDVLERRERTTRGYQRFRCRACGKRFNERSGGILNCAQYPSDVIAFVIFWRLRYKLSLRDLPEMFLIRGIEFSYKAVRDWEAKLTPTLIDNLRRRRKGRIGKSWYID